MEEKPTVRELQEKTRFIEGLTNEEVAQQLMEVVKNNDMIVSLTFRLLISSVVKRLLMSPKESITKAKEERDEKFRNFRG